MQLVSATFAFALFTLRSLFYQFSLYLALIYPVPALSLCYFRLFVSVIILFICVIYYYFLNFDSKIYPKQFHSRPTFISPNCISTLSLFHSLHVLFIFFFILFIPISIFQPLCSSHPPAFSSPTFLFPPIPHPSVCQSLDNISLSYLINLTVTGKSCLYSSPPKSTSFLLCCLLLLSGDVEINPGPVNISSLICAHLNVRSATSITSTHDKPTLIRELISDQHLDILTLSETWLTKDSLPSVLNSLTPPGFSLLHIPRPSHKLGGGVAVIYRSFLKATITPHLSSQSFESICIKFSISQSSFLLFTIYRSPSSSFSLFQSEFTSLLEDIVPCPSEIIFTGDFNFHVDIPTVPNSSTFLTLLETFNLTQHIHFPTHDLGHTLDLLITRSNSKAISNIFDIMPAISDHHAIIFNLNVPNHSRPSRITKLIRPINSINLTAFSNDILSSDLHHTIPTSLSVYVELFTTTLSALLNKHAPCKTITVPNNPPKPFITPEIKKEKTFRSKLETIWRKFKTPSNRAAYKSQSRKVSKLITEARRLYFKNFISQNQFNPKKLWSGLDTLLSRKPPSVLPTFSCPRLMASTFSTFFIQKIAKITSIFTPNISPTSVLPDIPLPYVPPQLHLFSPATMDEITIAISSSSNATCSLDPIPTELLKSCLPALILPITNIVNLSLSEGIFPDQFKNAIVTPLYKKHSLPQEDLSSYRPISNLNFISKIIERVIHSRLTNHFLNFPALSPFQSAYRPFHSTETALLRIQNDLLLAIDKKQVSALVLLDLSAAFDTIDHCILLNRLSTLFGISGLALQLLSSYLQNRTQSVLIGSHCSDSSPLSTGIPQGSVLGPLLFSLYTTPLSYLLSNSGVQFHFYADDTQIYLSFPSTSSASSLALISSTLELVHSWFTTNRLCLNPTKTEYLIIGSPSQRSKTTSTDIAISGNIISPTSSAKNLGIIFESDLTFHKHISSICQSSFYHIRHLRQIRSSIDTSSAIILANALVTTKLDYCNSLYYGLPNSSIHRLQLVQNSLARVILPSIKRHHHITPALQKLHWLPVNLRIKYKIASLTFKTLHYKLPSYLHQLLLPVPSSGRRSYTNNLLTVKRVTSSYGQRSFSSAAPTIWNSLPTALRLSSSYSVFRSSLKTFLFPP